MRLTFTNLRNLRPLWMPNGKHLVFDRESSVEHSISWLRADGSGNLEKLYSSKAVLMVTSLSPDGRRVAFTQQDPNTGMDLWTLPLDLSDPDHPKPGNPEPFLREPGDQLEPAFPPDGRWIAYISLEPSGTQVFVRPFPGGSAAGRWQISTTGRYPIWSNNGRELFSLSIDDHIMVVEYTAKGESFNAGRPRQWAPATIARTGLFAPLDLAPEGKRFVVLRAGGDQPGDDKTTVHLTVLLNYFDELRRKLK